MKQWSEVRLVVFLNHTSLFETLFIRLAPFSFIWRLSNRLLALGADVPSGNGLVTIEEPNGERRK